MRISLLLGVITFFTFFTNSSHAQCDPTVPYYQVDLSSNPDTTWVLLEADALDRDGQCCSAAANDNCIQFEITLNSNAAGNYFNYDGASAVGSLAWQIDCGTPYNLKDTICVSDTGPFTITFCKPGTDGGNYFVRSVAKPTFPEDQGVPLGCERPLEVLGVTAASINWTSIYPGSPGDYDTILSCTDCLDPVLTPYASLQPYVEFAMEGYPLMDYCTGAFTYYDTVRFTFQDSIKLSVDNPNATFCSGGNAVINASATGGDGNYTYHWYNSSLVEVYQGASFTTNVPGSYIVEVRDGNYEVGFCGGVEESFSVSESYPPIVDAGVDQVLCSTTPDADLVGAVTYATGGVWSGGAGVYTPSNTELITTYTPTHAELLAGSVTLTFTSTGAGGGCVNNSDDITLFFADTLKTDLADTVLNCNYGTVVFNPVVTGGVSPYSYQWGDGTTNLTNTVGLGNVCLTVTDAIGCTVTDCSNVTAPSAMTVSMSSVDATSDGATDGEATATPTGGTSPYTYLWSNSGTSQTETNLGYGVYSVVVTDDNGCSAEGSVVVNEPRCLGFAATTTSSNVLCFGDSTGSATVTLSGGTSPFTYSWNDHSNQTSATASNLPASVYTVVITDAVGCETITTATIVENDALSTTTSHIDATTLGGSDGAASVSVTGGQSPYNYSWSNSAITSSITGLTSNIYSVTVTDNVGCSIQDSVFVSEPPCNDFTIYTSATDALCSGSSDGTSNLNILNGVGPYTITWSTGQVDTTYIDNLSAGLYTVEVTDSRNCYTFTSYGINEPSPLSAGLSATGVSCNGEMDGTIDLTVSGGTYPSYTYSWSNGKTVQDIINLGSGTYSVTVTDYNGCQTIGSATISEPSALTYSYTTTDVTCYGGSDGAIDLSVGGGSLPYVYSWSNGATTQDLSGIDVGGYLLSLSDGNSCTMGSQISINVDEAAPVIIDTVIVSCPGQGNSTSQVLVSVSGGTADYQLSYDNGVSYNSISDYTEDLTNGNTYTLMAMDANGCLAIESYDVSIDTNVYLDAFSVNYCYASGQTTETLYITPTGGAGGDYQISTNNGISYNAIGDYDIDVAVNSSYNILIRDEKNCISETYPIALPDVLEVTTSVTSNYNGEDISCNGLADGEALASVTGGGAPYTYAWSDGQTTTSATSLSAGTYNVIVTDTNGCTASDLINLVDPVLLSSNSSVTSDYNGEDISCNGAADGEAQASATGGVSPYSYSWDNGATTSSITGLSAGTYTATITDANGCVATTSLTLTEPNSLTSISSVVSSYNGEDLTCFGASDGQAQTIANGGVLPYSYLWSDGQTTDLAVGLTSGSFNVTVTDANGCNSLSSVTLNDPSLLDVTTSVTSDYNNQDISCFGSADGQITATTSGGTGTYSYSWSSGQSSSIVSNLTAGTYTVTVTDVNGCTATSASSLSEPSDLTSTISVTSNYNGEDVSCFGSTDGEATVIANGGTSPYSYSWTDGQISSIATSLASGVHIVTITDVNGCLTKDTITLSQPTQLNSNSVVLSDYNGEDISCNGAADGEAQASATGGVAPYSYLWNNGATTSALAGLTAGTYIATITDANGCTSTTNISLTEPSILTSSTTVISNYNGEDISCYGAADGQSRVFPSGGVSPYMYLWSDGQTSDIGVGFVAGTYTVDVTDANGCLSQSSITLTEPTELTVTATITSNFNGQDISCYGFADGQATASASGGTGSYAYSWSNGQTTAVASALTAGVYTVVASDVNGCLSNVSVTVSEPNDLSSSIFVSSNYSGQDISCYGATDGEATINVTGGTTPYFYSWTNGQTNAIANSLAVGDHIVTVTDVNGCVLKDTITLSQPTQLASSISVVSNYNGEDVSCFGSSNGVSQIIPSGGTLPYSYLWSDGQTTNTASGLSVGLYTVQVNDVNGCINTNSITLSEPTEISISAVITDVSCNGGNDGVIDITPTGGVSPYIFQWSNGQTTEDATNLSASTYTVILTDDNGCKDTLENLVVDPTAINLSIEVTNVLCKNDSNGSIDLTSIGGTPPYSYSWNSGQTSEDISSQPAGSYSVTVTDDNGCYTDISGTITEPDSLLFDYSVTNVLCYGDQNGAIQTIVQGGTLPYYFNWSNGDTIQNIQDLFFGKYYVGITDSNGCFIGDSIEVTQPDSLWATLNSPTYFHGYNISLFGYEDGTIETEVFGGTEPYMFDWSNGDVSQNIDQVSAGEYALLVTDDNGCEFNIEIFLTQPMDLEMPTGFSPNSDGRNDLYEIHGIDAYPDNEVTIFNRWGNVVYQKKGYDNTWNGVSETGTNLPDGTYYVIVTINKGQEDEIEITNYIDLRR